MRGNGGSLNISFSDDPATANHRYRPEPLRPRWTVTPGSRRCPGHTRAPTVTSSICSWTQARGSAGAPSLVRRVCSRQDTCDGEPHAWTIDLNSTERQVRRRQDADADICILVRRVL